MIFGEERFFSVRDRVIPNGFAEFFLRYLGVDHYGIKMKGTFPIAWTKNGVHISGPPLFSDENNYNVSNVDYQRNVIWLNLIPSK